jgi:hypothetical protein
MKGFDELHMEGSLLVDADIAKSDLDCDIGISIGADGRVWICKNGQSLLRFKPNKKEMKLLLSHDD